MTGTVIASFSVCAVGVHITRVRTILTLINVYRVIKLKIRNYFIIIVATIRWKGLVCGVPIQLFLPSDRKPGSQTHIKLPFVLLH